MSGHPHREEPAPTVPRRPDASMTLLTEVMRRPLDPGYAMAARRRAAAEAAGEPVSGRRLRSRTGLVLLAAALGVAVTVATLALRTPAPSVLQARTLLEAQIEERTARADALATANGGLAGEIAALQAEALAGTAPGLAAQLVQDATVSGSAPVTGPGLRVTLEDGVPDDADPDGDADSRVQDIDLQVLVNGLWASGAEAVAVNGQRLTTLSAIRSAGSAILVDLVPLRGPYVVEAVGDAVEMQTRLARTSAGQHLAALRSTYGIGVALASVTGLELPGAGAVTLDSASVPEGVPVAPEPAPTTDQQLPSGPANASGPADVAPSSGREGTS